MKEVFFPLFSWCDTLSCITLNETVVLRAFYPFYCIHWESKKKKCEITVALFFLNVIKKLNFNRHCAHTHTHTVYCTMYKYIFIECAHCSSVVAKRDLFLSSCRTNEKCWKKETFTTDFSLVIQFSFFLFFFFLGGRFYQLLGVLNLVEKINSQKHFVVAVRPSRYTKKEETVCIPWMNIVLLCVHACYFIFKLNTVFLPFSNLLDHL